MTEEALLKDFIYYINKKTGRPVLHNFSRACLHEAVSNIFSYIKDKNHPMGDGIDEIFEKIYFTWLYYANLLFRSVSNLSIEFKNVRVPLDEDTRKHIINGIESIGRALCIEQ